MEKDVMAIATEIFNQIVAGVGVSVVYSWGIEESVATVTWRDGFERASLMLKVNGMLHKGWVLVALNEDKDLYEVVLLNKFGNEVGEWHDEVYCDKLGSLIDSLVERPEGISNAEYIEKLEEIGAFD